MGKVATVTGRATHQPRRTRRNSEAAFTLLEIMVALVVLTLIVTSAFGALRLGERSWEAGVTRANATEDMRMLSTFLRRQFRQVLPLSWLVDGKKRIAFAGDSEQVRFIAPAPHRRGAGGLLEYSLRAEPHSGGGTRLTLSYRLFDPGAPGLSEGESGQQLTLVEGLQAVSLRYYGAPDTDHPPAWHEHWSDDADAFPQLVHLHLTAANTARPWPDLYLSLLGGQTQ